MLATRQGDIKDTMKTEIHTHHTIMHTQNEKRNYRSCKHRMISVYL